jgi:hypothetical protein
MQELARTRYVAEQYPNLQGLTSIPFGLFCLELFLLGVGWLILPGTFFLWSIGITITLIVVATIFYRFVYGRSRPLQRVQRRSDLFAIGVAIVLAIVLFLNFWQHPPVSLAEIVLAGSLFLYYWPYRRFALHYLVIAVVIACIGLLPLFGGPLDHSIFMCMQGGCTFTLGFGSHLNLLSQSLAAVLMRLLLSFAILGIVGGFCDHLLLRRTFTPAKREV